jgi:16S rRNA (guanine527-N7)-methyltransferase
MNKLTKGDEQITDELVCSVLAPFGFQPPAGMLAAIRRYVKLLEKWNKRISLTSLKDTKEILERHFGESLVAVRAVPILQGRLADVGSGGGFPGLPIKMAAPKVDLTLIESNTRKAAFLSEVIRTLQLANARVVNQRMEEIHSLRDSLDFVTARALGNTHALLNWSDLSLRNDGKVVLWLGAEDAKEISLSPSWIWHQPISIPRSESRVLLIGQKN